MCTRTMESLRLLLGSKSSQAAELIRRTETASKQPEERSTSYTSSAALSFESMDSIGRGNKPQPGIYTSYDRVMLLLRLSQPLSFS